MWKKLSITLLVVIAAKLIYSLTMKILENRANKENIEKIPMGKPEFTLSDDK